MLEKNIISNVNSKKVFVEGELYRFYMDRDDIADNLVRRWKDDVHDPLEMSINIVQKIKEVYRLSMDEENDKCIINVKLALHSI